MSMSSEDIVQLASFGESAAFGPGETTGTMASAKAAKPSSTTSTKVAKPSTNGGNLTSTKAMKLDADSTSGKSGKGNNV